MADNDILLEVQHLRKYFPVKGMKGPGVQAMEDVSLFIKRGETLGLVGESGCEKLPWGAPLSASTSPPVAALYMTEKPSTKVMVKSTLQ